MSYTNEKFGPGGNIHEVPTPISSPPPTFNAYAQPQPQMNYAQQPQMPQQQWQQAPMQSQPQGTMYRQAVPIPALGMSAAPVDCPGCGQRAMTNISYHAGNTTHLWAAIIFFFTLCLCFIPYMVNSLKDVQHRCGNCGVLLATWHKSGATDVHMHA